jgi:hypothetical protein
VVVGRRTQTPGRHAVRRRSQKGPKPLRHNSTALWPATQTLAETARPPSRLHSVPRSTADSSTDPKPSDFSDRCFTWNSPDHGLIDRTWCRSTVHRSAVRGELQPGTRADRTWTATFFSDRRGAPNPTSPNLMPPQNRPTILMAPSRQPPGQRARTPSLANRVHAGQVPTATVTPPDTSLNHSPSQPPHLTLARTVVLQSRDLPMRLRRAPRTKVSARTSSPARS